jgi:hypothetical protein
MPTLKTFLEVGVLAQNNFLDVISSILENNTNGKDLSQFLEWMSRYDLIPRTELEPFLKRTLLKQMAAHAFPLWGKVHDYLDLKRPPELELRFEKENFVIASNFPHALELIKTAGCTQTEETLPELEDISDDEKK